MVAWKPIGHDPALPGLVAGTTIPTAVVWGDRDAVIAVETAEQWRLLLDARSEIVAGAPHYVELTHPEVIRRHLDGLEG